MQLTVFPFKWEGAVPSPLAGEGQGEEDFIERTACGELLSGFLNLHTKARAVLKRETLGFIRIFLD
jgi:hypothetical protein